MKKILRSLVACSASAICIVGYADSSSRAYDVDLVRSSVRAVLAEFSRQTGLQTGFYPNDPAEEGILVGPLKGHYTADEALGKLLASSGLAFVRENERTITVLARDGVTSESSAENQTKPEFLRLVDRRTEYNTGDPKGPKEGRRVAATVADGPQAGDLPASAARESGSKSPKGPAQQQLETLQEIIVTGSHIKGQADGASPVTVFTRVDIDRLGITTAGEMLRVIPQNQGSDATSPYSTLGAARYPNLRGLGEGTTLVLINGQRPASSAASLGAAPASAAQFNLDLIPATAIERIEVLRDGASAIYGSDAIGGVINIILRREYNGMELSAKYLTATDGDFTEDSYSGIAGGKFGRLSVLVGGEHYRRDSLVGAARPYSATLNKTGFGGTDMSFPGAAGPRPANVSALPDTGNLPGLSSPIAAVPSGAARPLQIADFSATQGTSNTLVDYTSFATLVQPQERTSGFGHLDLSLSDTWSANTDVLYSKSDSSIPFTFPFVDFPFGAGNPYNPFGVDTLVSFYLADVPAYLALTRTEDFSISSGITGKVGSEWNLNTTAFFGESRLHEAESATDYGAVVEALLATTHETALNPLFDGRSTSPGVLQSFLQSALDGRATVRGYGINIGATGPVLELAAGTTELAIGAEARKDHFDTETTSVNLTTPVVVDKDRTAGAAYAELNIPILGAREPATIWHNLDLSLALRYEHFDDFGSTTNPKAGIRWEPVNGLTVRGTWGTAFQAPSLSQLYTSPTAQSGALFGPIYDPVLNQTYVLSDSFILRGNADLRPQKADTLSAGLSYERSVGSGSWNASVDFFRVKFRDRLRSQLSPQDLIDLEGLFPDLVIRDTVSGQITDVISKPINVAEVNTDGIDFSLGYQMPLMGGTFEALLSGTLVTKYDLKLSPTSPVEDRLSYIGFSNRLKSNVQLQYSRGPLSASAIVFYADDYQSNVQPDRPIGSLTTVDVQVSYACCGSGIALLKDLKLSLGVINLFDREPPFYNNTQGFDLGEGDPIQRRIYAKLSAAF